MRKLAVAAFFSVCLCIPQILRAQELPGTKINPPKISTYTPANLEVLMENQNTNLRKARQEYTKSLLDLKDARGGFSPAIDLTVSGTYMFNPPIGPLRITADDIANSLALPPGILPPEWGITVYEGMEKTLYSFQLTLTQPIFTWGKIYNAVKLYETVTEVRALQMEICRSQLESELHTRLVSLYYLAQIKQLLIEQNQIVQELVSISEDAERNGALLRQNILESIIKAKELALTIYSVQDQFEKILQGVRSLTGLENLEWTQIHIEPDEKNFTAFAQGNKSLLEKQALSPERLSFQILSKLVKTSEHAKKIASASIYWKPDLALKVSVGYGGFRFPFLEKGWQEKDDYSANFTIAIKSTLWDGGKKYHDIQRGQSDIITAGIELEDARHSIRETFQEQYNNMELSQVKLEYLTLKIETAELKILQQKEYSQSGYGSLQGLLQAKIDLYATKIEYLREKIALATAYYTLNYLLNS